jgi:2-polyprenyl-6-methoxyphenol hydroxylase-like FAD-dependent oxidoreductase
MDPDVLVVGAGPVGLMLACELALQGISTVVLERSPQPPDEVRAQSLHGRTVPTLDRRGLLQRFQAAERELNGGGGDSLKKRPLPKLHFAGITGLAVPKPVGDGPAATFVPQVVTARLLAERATELGIEIRREHEFEGFVQDDEGVTLQVRGPAGVRRMSAKFLVGCDGARSKVRKAAGIAYTGSEATLSTVAGDVRLLDVANVPAGWQRTPRGCTVISPHPGDGLSRVVAIDFSGPPADRDAPVTFDELQGTVSRIVGRDIPMANFTAGSRYSDAARQAEQYRNGRVFLVGDSAHMHYPVGGQGLNVGIQDAVNLGWKLAADVKGWAPPSLLDTYHSERHPVAASVLVHTRAQIALLNPDERVDPLRALMGELIGFDQVGSHLFNKISALDVCYKVDSSHALAGQFAPDLRLLGAEGRRRLAALLHTGRPVLLDLGDRPEVRQNVAGWDDRVTVELARCPDRPDLEAMLIRPDGYVVWASSPDDPLDVVKRDLPDALGAWFGA